MTMQIKLDLRSAFSQARDQGPRPTCMAFAVSSAHEAGLCNAGYLSVEHLFYKGVQRSHQNPNRGLTPLSVSEALLIDGQPKEAAWPYQLAVPSIAEWKPPKISAQIYRGEIKFSSNTVADVREFLRQTQLPVVLVLDLSTSFYQPDMAARVYNVPHDSNTARHAVLAVGFGQDDAGTYLLVRNSWGEGWGDRGHAWLHDDYLAKRLLTVGVLSKTTKSGANP